VPSVLAPISLDFKGLSRLPTPESRNKREREAERFLAFNRDNVSTWLGAQFANNHELTISIARECIHALHRFLQLHVHLSVQPVSVSRPLVACANSTPMQYRSHARAADR
jgi:hypothetical protein